MFKPQKNAAGIMKLAGLLFFLWRAAQARRPPQAGGRPIKKERNPYSGSSAQRFLRSRISYVEIDKDGNAGTPGDIARSVYSYDPHGNVEWVEHDLPGGYDGTGTRVSAKVEYEYDLVSGKVLKLKYQSGKADNFFTRYTYDSDNRIRSVESSRDGVIWERDAQYGYYAHGPLKRILLGQDGVQGIDFTYTIHGWLKAINHPHASDRTKDPGQDGVGSSAVPADAFSMALHYFNGDFSRAGSAFNTAGTAEPSVRPVGANNLYNGNISGWVQRTMTADATPEIRTFAGLYTYDRLNRLRGSRRSYWSDNAFGPPTNKLASEYSYDPNGNLEMLNRWTATGDQFFDNLGYSYTAGTNRLAWIADNAPSTSRHQGSTGGPNIDLASGVREYTYDASGNITEEAGKSISWTPYGKVETVQKETGAGEVRFLYDAHGNRILKEEVDGGNVTRRTWYVYDAAGVLLTTYEQSGVGNQITAKEYMIYGTGRVGVALSNAALNGTPVTSSLYSRVVGGKRYDLTDHLGNVRSTLADVKVRDGSTFAAQVMGYTEYFPFGMVASEGGTAGSFGFNGVERVDELRGAGNYYATDFRGLDPRIGRWLAQDAIVKEWESPYASFANNPILFVDPLGLDPQNAGGSSSGAPGSDPENAIPLPGVTVTAERIQSSWFDNAISDLGTWLKTALHASWEFLKRVDWMEVLHFSLDVAGLAPGLGEGADLINAAIYLAEGRHEDAALSVGSALPFGGWAATAAKFGKRAAKLGKHATKTTLHAANSIWNIAPLKRGFVYEAMRGGNLVQNYPVIDKFDFATGMATSIKTLDLNASTYVKNNKKIYSLLKGYIDKLDKFQGTYHGSVQTTGKITSKVLDVGIPSGGTTAQMQEIHRAIQYAKTKGITLIINTVQ